MATPPHVWTEAEDEQLRQLNESGSSLADAVRAMEPLTLKQVRLRSAKLELTWGNHPGLTAARNRVALSNEQRRAKVAENELLILELAQERVLEHLRDRKKWTTITKLQGGGELIQQVDKIPSRDLADENRARQSASTTLDKLQIKADANAAATMDLLNSMAQALGLTDAKPNPTYENNDDA